jgi:hypothetical protein
MVANLLSFKRNEWPSGSRENNQRLFCQSVMPVSLLFTIYCWSEFRHYFEIYSIRPYDAGRENIFTQTVSPYSGKYEIQPIVFTLFTVKSEGYPSLPHTAGRE